jgi:hypothetical protein
MNSARTSRLPSANVLSECIGDFARIEKMPDNYRVTDNADSAYSETSSRRCVLQNSMGKLIDAGEFDPELLLDRRHVDRISRCIAQH